MPPVFFVLIRLHCLAFALRMDDLFFCDDHKSKPADCNRNSSLGQCGKSICVTFWNITEFEGIKKKSVLHNV